MNKYILLYCYSVFYLKILFFYVTLNKMRLRFMNLQFVTSAFVYNSYENPRD